LWLGFVETSGERLWLIKQTLAAEKVLLKSKDASSHAPFVDSFINVWLCLGFCVLSQVIAERSSTFGEQFMALDCDTLWRIRSSGRTVERGPKKRV
jgi:hypothetical protein